MSNAAVVCMPTLTSHYNVVLHHFVSTVLCDGRCKLPAFSLLQSVLIHAVHYVEKLPSTGVGMPAGQPVLALTNGPYVRLYVVRCMYTQRLRAMKLGILKILHRRKTEYYTLHLPRLI